MLKKLAGFLPELVFLQRGSYLNSCDFLQLLLLPNFFKFLNYLINLFEYCLLVVCTVCLVPPCVICTTAHRLLVLYKKSPFSSLLDELSFSIIMIVILCQFAASVPQVNKTKYERV